MKKDLIEEIIIIRYKIGSNNEQIQDFFTVQVYSYYPMFNGDDNNPANCISPLTIKNIHGRDWNQQQIFDSIEACMDWMRKTGIEKDIYPLISTCYLGNEKIKYIHKL
jgi:hypothetical protein